MTNTNTDDIIDLLSSFAEAATNYCKVTQDPDTEVRMADRAVLVLQIRDALRTDLSAETNEWRKATLALMVQDMNNAAAECKKEQGYKFSDEDAADAAARN